MFGSKWVVQDGQRYRVGIRDDLIPGWDRIRQLSEFISVEIWATFVTDLVLRKVCERCTVSSVIDTYQALREDLELFLGIEVLLFVDC